MEWRIHCIFLLRLFRNTVNLEYELVDDIRNTSIKLLKFVHLVLQITSLQIDNIDLFIDFWFVFIYKFLVFL